MKLTVIIVAAGSGQRMGCEANKALLPLAGQPVLGHVLALWQGLADELMVVTRQADWQAVTALSAPYGGAVKLTEGGTSRAESVARALAALPISAPAQELIAVHDAARPLTLKSDVEHVIAAAEQQGAAILAAPVNDTIRWQAEGGCCGENLPRARLLAAQTPQIFRAEWLLAAYGAADEETLAAASDDASLVLAAGYPCAYVWAEGANLKLTRPEDMILAEAIYAHRHRI